MTDRSTIIPPGEIIRDELEERGWTQEDLARILGRPLAAVSEVIMGKRSITPQTARELGEAFGTSPEFWLNLESMHQLAKAGHPSGEVRRRARLFEAAPVKEMEKRGWIKRTKDTSALEGELCRFYGVPSLETPRELTVAARQSVSEESLTASQIAWCYRALTLARAVHSAEYSVEALRGALPALREFARSPESTRHVPRLLSEAGVRLVIIEHLTRTRIDGAALWSESGPVIAVSLRYDRVDWFWHTLLHEVSHVLHEDRSPMLDVDLSRAEGQTWSVRPEIEQRANEDATTMLIPPDQMNSFILRVKPLYSKSRIVQFANRIKMHPGIIVGQLQYRGEINYATNREMLVKIRHHIIGHAMTDGFGHSPQVA